MEGPGRHCKSVPEFSGLPEETEGGSGKIALEKKKSDPEDPSNYHPVSNLSFLGKVVEKTAAKQLQTFLDDTLALDSFQSSFCPSYGTEVALVALIDDLSRQLDQGR